MGRQFLYFLDVKDGMGEQLLVAMGFYNKVGSDTGTAGNKSAVFKEKSLPNRTGDTTRWHNGVLSSNFPFSLSKKAFF